MATVIEFPDFLFDAADTATLSEVLSEFEYPGGYQGWTAPKRANGRLDSIDMMDPNDWEPLTLTRSRSGEYQASDADGVRLIPADTIVLCAGQEPERTLAYALIAAGRSVHVIGGADVAAELDAKRAIDQGTRLAARL